MKVARRLLLATSIGVTGSIVLAQPSWADWHGDRRGDWHRDWHGDRHGDWHGEHFHGDIRFFDDHDRELWRAGRWEHVIHDGRLGWWWVAAGGWYFYPAPIYPYPDPYAPPVAVAMPPAPPAGQGLPPQPKFWYHCSAPDGYYPYVASCPGSWQAVPAMPGQPPVVNAAPVPAR